MTSLSREMLLRSSLLSRALLEGSLSYRYDMRPSGKHYEVPICYSDSVFKYMTGLLAVMSGELILSPEPFIMIITF